MAEVKRLYRSSSNKTFMGVLGGVGEYFDVDPVLLRVVFLVLTVFSGVVPGLLVYILAAAIMPIKK